MNAIIPDTLQEITVSYSLNGSSPSDSQIKIKDLLQIRIPDDAHKAFRSIWKNVEYRESFYMILLNNAKRVIGYHKISEGSVDGTVCDPKIIFGVALKANASSIILAHNHPSGNTHPSDSDRSLTRKNKVAGELLDLPVLDHLILSPDENEYFSFLNEGLL